MIKALVSDKVNGEVVAKVSSISEENLPEGNVLVRIDHSSLNYTDARTMFGMGSIVKKFPHVAGNILVLQTYQVCYKNKIDQIIKHLHSFTKNAMRYI